ncbi:hypothetical protein PHMEG_00010390 [Phytophthora megakarya]|uniref:Reverse transcriptase/retrotransposon-derived protein RNase H-like domain-containing protein n=1 Tax=Phytophthora megakarya TaxID=4795 RepID=A0A225WDT3_9STRA|nr:hypothetical protein PHMEG_00010390 [Phytophthora megakarya]
MRLLFGIFDFAVVYLDDLCIFSRMESKHLAHGQRLNARLSKNHFGCTSVDFLGYTVSGGGLRVDGRKARTIETWPVPASAKNLQKILGLCGYYRHFIGEFADIVLPLSNLLKKDAAWSSTRLPTSESSATATLVLSLLDHEKCFVVTTYASGYSCGAILSLVHDGVDHPVTFLSKKLSRHEVN